MLHSHVVRNYFSLTWESFSSSSSCGTAPSSRARGSPPQRSCRPHRTRRCQSPPQQQGKLCLGKPLSAWRWRTPQDYGLLGPPQSPAVVRERKRYYTQIRASEVLIDWSLIVINCKWWSLWLWGKLYIECF